MEYRAKTSTWLKKLPIEASTLEDNQKVFVPQGKTFTLESILETNGLHSQVKLGFEAGAWWLFLPHWDSGSSGQVTAEFSLKQAESMTLIFGDLVFKEDGKEILRVKATSGQANFQDKGDHTIRAKGCIPPDKDWKISTHGRFISANEQPGIAGMFYHITPDPDPETGRSEFGLHRDANEVKFPGSAGCIVVKTADFQGKVRPLIDGIREKQPEIPLTVIYT